jgi:hypothetical protein
MWGDSAVCCSKKKEERNQRESYYSHRVQLVAVKHRENTRGRIGISKQRFFVAVQIRDTCVIWIVCFQRVHVLLDIREQAANVVNVTTGEQTQNK